MSKQLIYCIIFTLLCWKVDAQSSCSDVCADDVVNKMINAKIVDVGRSLTMDFPEESKQCIKEHIGDLPTTFIGIESVNGVEYVDITDSAYNQLEDSVNANLNILYFNKILTVRNNQIVPYAVVTRIVADDVISEQMSTANDQSFYNDVQELINSQKKFLFHALQSITEQENKGKSGYSTKKIFVLSSELGLVEKYSLRSITSKQSDTVIRVYNEDDGLITLSREQPLMNKRLSQYLFAYFDNWDTENVGNIDLSRFSNHPTVSLISYYANGQEVKSVFFVNPSELNDLSTPIDRDIWTYLNTAIPLR